MRPRQNSLDTYHENEKEMYYAQIAKLMYTTRDRANRLCCYLRGHTAYMITENRI